MERRRSYRQPYDILRRLFMRLKPTKNRPISKERRKPPLRKSGRCRRCGAFRDLSFKLLWYALGRGEGDRFDGAPHAPAALRPPSANAAGAAILGSILPLLIPCLLPRKDVIAIKPL